MLKWLGKVFAEKLAGLVALVLVIGLIVLLWRYHHLLPTWGDVGMFFLGLLLWLALTTLLPWATFFLVGWVNRASNNIPAIVLLLCWALTDTAMAVWLVRGWPGPAQWIAGGLAFCLGGLYNLIAANQIAMRMEH